jgi:integrase
MTPPNLLTPAEVAAWLHKSRNWVKRHSNGTSNPHLPAFKVGSEWRYREDELMLWIERQEREAAGIKDLTLRQARATFATLIAGDVKDVQELLGHSTAEMTLRHYKKAIPERQVASVEELDRRLMRPALRLMGGRGR